LPFTRTPQLLNGVQIRLTVSVARGEELAARTLNPRLGIVGGISILGNTGIVKPFSHEAYEETIHSALEVAQANGCRTVVLSTGGKSEKYARALLPQLRPEAFVQIADFFAFAVETAARCAVTRIVHSVFFGKAVKMAQGHRYTHAHRVAMDLGLLVDLARRQGLSAGVCDELRRANTARHALRILQRHQAQRVIDAVARKACEQSSRLAGGACRIRILLFDYEGSLLADVEGEQQ